jgi:hypothetical protein
MKKAVVEKKVGEMKDYMERVVALVHEYVPPNPQKIQAAQAAGNIAITPAQPITTLNIKNYLKPGVFRDVTGIFLNRHTSLLCEHL